MKVQIRGVGSLRGDNVQKRGEFPDGDLQANGWFLGCSLQKLGDLPGATFEDMVDFSFVNIEDANLREGNFGGVTLRNADITGANLENTVLTRA